MRWPPGDDSRRISHAPGMHRIIRIKHAGALLLVFGCLPWGGSCWLGALLGLRRR